MEHGDPGLKIGTEACIFGAYLAKWAHGNMLEIGTGSGVLAAMVAGVFKIEQLENWYANGTIRDITQHIVSDEFDIERSKAYKKVNFKYQKGESFLNEEFMSRSKVPYGDLYYELDNDGEEYTVELPFENLLHNKFTGTNLQVGYALKPSYIPYIPKPVILYDYGSTQTVSNYHFNDGNSTINHTTANIFGQGIVTGKQIGRAHV